MEVKKRRGQYVSLDNQSASSGIHSNDTRSPLRAKMENLAWVALGIALMYYIDIWNYTVMNTMVNR